MKPADLRRSSGPVTNCLGDLHLISRCLNYLICTVILRLLLLDIWQVMRDRKDEGSKILKIIFSFAYFGFILPLNQATLNRKMLFSLPSKFRKSSETR